ncbi:MAG TPA: helix-turn-helix transcriptional regulator [Gemmataceae bacterium]|jgi:DNA-binding XRE family transcriptional regulator|nr:helix-turn-helix transcriptional regulator [Gemmataceae bacterium]
MVTKPSNNSRHQAHAKKIRQLRMALGHYQHELAELAGVNKKTVENMEAGRRATWKCLQKVAKALKTTPEDLIVNEETAALLGLNGSGIVRCYERLDGRAFEQLLLQQPTGPVVIVNTWIENFRDICGLLTAALSKTSGLKIDLYQLNPDAPIVKQRALELDSDVASRIRGENEKIKDFVDDLIPEQRIQVTEHSLDFIPKFSLYMVGDQGLVGFYWPSKTAVSKPQLHIRGRTGFFALEVWSYLESIHRPPTADE